MKPVWSKLLVVVLTVVLVASLIVAFTLGRKEAAMEAIREKPIKTPTRVEVINGEKVVALDAATRTRSGVALAPLDALGHRREIPAYGVVLDLQELTDLRHAVEAAQAQLNKSTAAREVARKDYERVRALYAQDQNVSQKAVQAAEGSLQAEAANMQTAQAALHAAQATALQHWGGRVADWLVQAAPEFEQLWTQQNLLVQVTLAPGQGGLTAPPAASVQTADGELVAARFVSLAPRTDARIQGKSFLYVIAAVGANLLPGMNVTARLPVGETVQGVVVPASAAVWLQGKAWAYVQVQPDRFARREVATEQPVPGGWFQPEGFVAGERLVVQGAQVLLSEEFRAQISVGEEGK